MSLDRIDGNGIAAVGPEEIVMRAFARCQNFPKERIGVLGLAQGLRVASDKFGVPMERIVSSCVSESPFCPTDYDLMNVARGMRVEKQVGPRSCPHDICDGSGWRQVCHMHTARGRGDASWVEKEIISRGQYENLASKVAGTQQKVFESRYRCKCHPANEPDKEPKARRAGKLTKVVSILE